MQELLQIQSRLKVPKANVNTFGKYNYRKCEDILEAVKPICHSLNCFIMVSDEIVEIGGRIYIKATATIYNGEGKSISTTAYAREADKKAGMDDAQVTGAASSYARKYALNGLLAIDDTKDPDTNEYRKESEANASQQKKTITSVLLDDETKCNGLLKWIKTERDKHSGDFDIIAYVRKHYEIDERNATRLITLYNIHAK